MIKKEHLIDAIICRENEPVLEVSRILRDTQRRHLIVIDQKDKPAGLISTVDINNRVMAEDRDSRQTLAKNIMTKNVKTLDIEDDYEKAFQEMAKLGTHSIPVLKNDKLIGLLEFHQAFRQRCKK